MNQASGTIIQIGAVAFKAKNGEILGRFSRTIKINERINPEIVILTGITQEMVDAGVDLKQAYVDLCEFRKKYKVSKQTVTWGTGDTHTLKTQVASAYNAAQKEFIWDLGFRFFDTKTLFQAIRLSKNETMKAGLSTAMKIAGLEFEGRAHNALVDAENTAKMFSFILKKLSSI